MTSPEREDLVSQVAAGVPAAPGRCVLVAVDGVDGAGKSVFADELAAALERLGRTVVRVSIDGFHRPSAERYRRGRRSPQGFFLDSYDYEAFRREVLEPFAVGPPHSFRPAVHDVVADEPLALQAEPVPVDSVLVVDGIFLHRDELVCEWDFSFLLQADLAEAYRRMAERDGVPADPGHERNQRYVRGQELYVETCFPETRADVVIDNTLLARPRIVSL